jgi:hypothetical protein
MFFLLMTPFLAKHHGLPYVIDEFIHGLTRDSGIFRSGKLNLVQLASCETWGLLCLKQGLSFLPMTSTLPAFQCRGVIYLTNR